MSTSKTSQGKIMHKEQVDELANQLQWLKKSEADGGLPDMHIESILKWYVETVDSEVRKVLDRLTQHGYLMGGHGKEYVPIDRDVIEAELAALKEVKK